MRFIETTLSRAFIIELEPIVDERDFFVRSRCQPEFEAQGLIPRVVQCNLFYTRLKGTVRCMHFQACLHDETKLVRRTLGRIFGVIVALPPASGTFLEWFGFELSGENRKSIYIPEEFEYGHQILSNDKEAFYQMSECYYPGSSREVRWEDPAFSITWPLAFAVISERDRSYPDFREVGSP